MQQIRLRSGERLALELTPPADAARTTAVYVHGLGSNRGGEKALFFERELVARGFGFARFDFRGHGDSDGRFGDLTLSRQLEDLAAVLAFLNESAAAPRRVLLIGASLGGLTAAWHTALTTSPLVFAQVLIAPAFRIIDRYLAALGDFGRARWEREGTYRFVGPWFEFDLKWDVVRESELYTHDRLLRETRLPTLIVHGTQDESAPVAQSVEFAQRCAGTRPRLVLLDGGDHRLTAFKERLVAETLAFVATIDAGATACAR